MNRTAQLPPLAFVACLVCFVPPSHADSLPDTFAFDERNGVAPGSVQHSNPITVVGIDERAVIAVLGGTYSVNGNSYTSASSTVLAGDVVQLRAIASPSFSASSTSTLNIGGITASFRLRTDNAPAGVAVPSAFKLDKLLVPDIQGLMSTKSFFVPTGQDLEANRFVVKGLGSAQAPISIVGGRYSLNGGDFTTSPAVLKNGASIAVRADSSPSPNDARSTTLYIGAYAASFNLFTRLDTAALTPTSLVGTQTYVVRDWGVVPQRAFVYRPKNWSASDRRTCMVFFFGGGWTSGEPSKSVSWAKWAASKGMVGVAPDYRTNQRFGTTPLAAVDDARAAVRWAQDQATTLGIDPARVVVGGVSAGGHLALWGAIHHTPPGSDPSTAPRERPAAVVLISAVSDTSVASGYTPVRFGIHADALSPQAQLPPTMPPTIAFHGDADTTVPVMQSERLCERMTAAGNICQFVKVPGGTHSYRTQADLPGDWKNKTNSMIEQFLRDQALLP